MKKSKDTILALESHFPNGMILGDAVGQNGCQSITKLPDGEFEIINENNGVLQRSIVKPFAYLIRYFEMQYDYKQKDENTDKK